MKYLYLVRHAKSSWKYDLKDFDRPLNQRGEFDAPLMGKVLRERRVMPDFILSSPASRAIKTATIIAEKLKYLKPIGTLSQLYHASPAVLLDEIKKCDDHIDHLMVFGHNPGLTSFANQLTTEWVDNIPTCGVFAVSFQLDSWKNTVLKKGKLLFYDFPKNHKK